MRLVKRETSSGRGLRAWGGRGQLEGRARPDATTQASVGEERRRRRARLSRSSVPLAAACFVPVASAAGLYALVVPAAATSLWHVSRGPKLEVHLAAGCPKSVRGYEDVVNTFAGPPLVPASPTSGLICRYKPTSLPEGAGLLARQTHLDALQARRLAGAVRKLNLSAPTDIAYCPADFGSVALIGFAYPRRADVGLWYETSGCQSVDNGRLGAFEPGNSSFYIGFLRVVNNLSPPLPTAMADGSPTPRPPGPGSSPVLATSPPAS